MLTDKDIKDGQKTREEMLNAFRASRKIVSTKRRGIAKEMPERKLINLRRDYYYWIKENYFPILKHPSFLDQNDSEYLLNAWRSFCTMSLVRCSNHCNFLLAIYPESAKYFIEIGKIKKILPLRSSFVDTYREGDDSYSKDRVSVEKDFAGWFLEAKEQVKTLIAQDCYFFGNVKNNSPQYFMEKFVVDKEDKDSKDNEAKTVQVDFNIISRQTNVNEDKS